MCQYWVGCAEQGGQGAGPGWARPSRWGDLGPSNSSASCILILLKRITDDKNTKSQEFDRIGRMFAAALLPRLFWTKPRSHHKGATGRVRTGDQRRPVLQFYAIANLDKTSLRLLIFYFLGRRDEHDIFIFFLCVD